jgi:MerR family transcriptional regulator, thiopeptide resistance regulator
MEYSMNDMAKLAKVSARTLRYYDEIGLLKPAFRMESGRRYYLFEQLLIMMDINFFKSLGFSLKKIQLILTTKGVNKNAIMAARKQFFQREIKRMKELIKCIDETEFYFKEENIDTKEITKRFEHFRKDTKEYRRLFEKEFGKLEDEESEKVKKMSVEKQLEHFDALTRKVDMKRYNERTTTIVKKLIIAITDGKKADSKHVQDLMKEYFDIVNMLQQMSKKKWLGIGIEISHNHDAYLIWAKIHPKLPEFLFKAVKIYGDSLAI